MRRYFQDRAVGANKRARTRSVLLDSAVSVFAEAGIGNTRIDDITKYAGMANATFYNHFKDKSELVGATVIAIAGEVSKAIDAEMADIEDAALRVAVATSRFLRITVHEQLWGPVLVEAFYLFPEHHLDLGGYLLADIQRGVEQGIFKATPDQFLLDQAEALVMSGLRVLGEDDSNPEIIEQTSENVLRVLGMTPAKARRAVDKAQSVLEGL